MLWQMLKLLAPAVSKIIGKKIFPDAEVRGSAGGINAICIRPEVADDVISGYNVETFWDYDAVNLWVASFSGFP